MNRIPDMLDENGNIIPEKWEEFQAIELAKIEAARRTPPPLTMPEAMAIIEDLSARVAHLEGRS